MFSYGPLRYILAKKKIKRKALQDALHLSPTTIAKINRNEFLSMEVLDKICTYLDCNIEDVVVHIKPIDFQKKR
ncbi:MAG: helix-turn-helix transcriptional regulator [Firmicutes bacterium]|nr:helix-turn-helix transcriptional regulator [Bacillota bacterium]